MNLKDIAKRIIMVLYGAIVISCILVTYAVVFGR